MSDTALPKFIQYGTHANRLAFTPSPAAGTTPLYVWYETDTNTTWVYDTTWHQISSSSVGDVVGPGSATDRAIAIFSGTTGKIIQNSAPVIDAGGHITVVTDPVSAQDAATKNYVDTTANATNRKTRQVVLIIDGGGSVIATGIKGFVTVPYTGTITKWRILSSDASATSGSIVFDIWKDVYANYPPTVADTITAAAKPTLSAAIKAESSTLTGWTTSVTAGDVLGFNVDSASTVTKVNLELTIQL